MSDQMFQPDVVLASQFFASSRHALGKTGEYRLLVALFEDAIARFQKYVLTRNRLFKEAEQWIMGTDEDGASAAAQAASAFSFDYVCSVLDFDPASVRRALQRWRAEQLLRRP
jgi:hypothetical protein